MISVNLVDCSNVQAQRMTEQAQGMNKIEEHQMTLTHKIYGILNREKIEIYIWKSPFAYHLTFQQICAWNINYEN